MCCFEVGSIDLADFLSSRLGMDGFPNLHSPFNHEHKKGYRQAASILGPITRSTLNGAPKTATENYKIGDPSMSRRQAAWTALPPVRKTC